MLSSFKHLLTTTVPFLRRSVRTRRSIFGEWIQIKTEELLPEKTKQQSNLKLSGKSSLARVDLSHERGA